jgi:Ca-activated chloride channel family protein
MNWGYPGYIWLGVLLALLVLGGSVWAWFHRERVLGLFVSRERVSELSALMPTWEYWLRAGLIGGAVVLIGLALAAPRWGFVLEKSRVNSLDVLVAVDTSRSMLAEDLRPNRMKRTRLAIHELLELGAGDRFGLIPFAGSAFLQCPLTVDQEALRQHVNLVNVDLIPQGGTKIGEAIGEAMKAFAKHEQESHKVLVLFSDGEDHDDDAVNKAREAAESGMRIFTIGTGTPAGDLIPTVTCRNCEAPNVPGKNRCHECEAYLSGDKEFMRDAEGRIVRSRLNEEMLQEIAEITGGFYLRLQGPRTMEILHKNGLAPLPKSENNNAMVRRQIERFQWPLAGAILLLLAELLWPAGRRRAKTSTAVALTALLLLALPSGTQAASQKHAHQSYQGGEFALALVEFEELLKENPGDPRLNFNAGTAAYQAGKHAEADKHLRAALHTRDLTLQQRAFYNLGNNHFRQGQQLTRPEDQIPVWEDAATSYEAAVQLNGSDTAARRNLAFVRAQITKAKHQLEQLTDEVPLDGVTRFKNQQEKKIMLRVFPPKREMIPERPYWRMFALDEYAHGVAKVSDSLRQRASASTGALSSGHGGRAPVEAEQTGEWRFRFEPLFSEFLPFSGPFEKAEVEAGDWHYNAEVFHGRLPEMPSKAVHYLVTDPTGNARLAPSALDEPLMPEHKDSFSAPDETMYPHTTLTLALRDAEKKKLREVVALISEEKDLPVEDFTKRVIAFLHQNHKYTRQTRIPEDDREDPVLRWMLSKEEGHCEYFAYSYVLLARAAGHPARIVCGFAGGKWENKTQCWVNLQTDAHAWAEVFDGTHWVRVEATPPEDGQREGEGQQNQENQPNENPGEGQKNPNDPNGQGEPQQPQQDDQQPNEDRDEGELPPELLETLRQAERLLDAMKTDEKPLSAIEDQRGKRGLFQRRPKKNW